MLEYVSENDISQRNANSALCAYIIKLYTRLKQII